MRPRGRPGPVALLLIVALGLWSAMKPAQGGRLGAGKVGLLAKCPDQAGHGGAPASPANAMASHALLPGRACRAQTPPQGRAQCGRDAHGPQHPAPAPPAATQCTGHARQRERSRRPLPRARGSALACLRCWRACRGWYHNGHTLALRHSPSKRACRPSSRPHAGQLPAHARRQAALPTALRPCSDRPTV